MVLEKGYSKGGAHKGVLKRVLNTGTRKGVLTGYSHGTHAGSGSDGPVCNAAFSRAHGTQCSSACVRHHRVDSWVGERHRTKGDLARGARRVLDGYSTAEYRVHRSAPVRQHCGCCLVTATHSDCTRVRVRSADTRADGHARADQRRRHQPTHARADDVGAECCRPDGYER